MKIFRIEREKYAADLLSGRGASLAGGRWNRVHTPAVYCAESRALSILEMLVHLRRINLLPEDRMIFTLMVPEDKIVRVDGSDLPDGWNRIPESSITTKDLFQDLCVTPDRLAMMVPSVVVPEETNLVLNPACSFFKDHVQVLSQDRLSLDKRLL